MTRKRAVVSFALRLAPLVALGLALPGAAAAVTIGHTPPSVARADKRLDLTFRVEPVSDLGGATVAWRPIGSGTWKDAPIRLSSTGAWEASIPADALSDPGVEYHVVATDLAGTPTAVFASAAEPHPVFVRSGSEEVLHAVALRELRGQLGELRVLAQHVDFRTLGLLANRPPVRWNDVRASYRHWFARRLEYVEAGFGWMRGDAEGPARFDGTRARTLAGFHRGWAQAGLRANERIGLHGRVLLAVDEDDFQIGVAAGMRIGRPRQTRLELEGGVATGVGTHVVAGFHVATVPRVPLALEIEVTNYPDAGADYGEIARLRAGLDITDSFTLHFVASYQALTGQEHGLGAGLGFELRP